MINQLREYIYGLSRSGKNKNVFTLHQPKIKMSL